MKPSFRPRFLLALGLLAALAGCVAPQATAGTVLVYIEVDGERQSVYVPSGSTVQLALEAAGVELGELDRVDPPSYTLVASDMLLRVTRVSERFEVETVVVPFERQTIRSEVLPEGESRLLQPGSNGLDEITYRIVLEEGVELSRTAVRRTTLNPPRPEIIMVGIRTAFAPLSIEGTLSCISADNAWTMRGDTASRLAVGTGGDLDGQVFRLSPDSLWLLYTRREEGGLAAANSLWVISLSDPEAAPIDLGARNVHAFADWSPIYPPYTIAYTTVEPRSAPPGWQANNDLVFITFDPAKSDWPSQELISANPGGTYGWWGTTYAWAPNGQRLSYARPDSVGTVEMGQQGFRPWLEIVPYQTLGDWAWVPGVAWGHDSQTLYVVVHGAPLGLEEAAASPVFDLVAMRETEQDPIPLVARSGMFASPSVAPHHGNASGEQAYQIAFVEALSPLESESSHYRLNVMDRDGSNRKALFPAPGEQGLAPQQVVWSPGGDRIALIYRGDLWIVDIVSGQGQRVTGDGQTVGCDWKP